MLNRSASRLTQVLLALPLSFAFAVPSASFLSSELRAAEEGAGWRKVENPKVCMVTDTVFPKAQIPVTVAGKTYYGCCENCKDRLAKDEEVRFGIDPVSGKKVDKAGASIAAGPDGSVSYFENDANLKTFIAKQK